MSVDRSRNAPSHDQLAATSIDPLEVASDDDMSELSAGVAKVLKSYVVHLAPTISVVPHFLTDAEVEHLLELSKDYWEPSVVGHGVYKTDDEAKDLTNKFSPNRTSYSCMLKSSHTRTVESIEHRLAHLAGIDVDYLERLNMVRYSPGQLFNRHHDGRFRPKTVFIYLNDLPDNDSGETLFPELGVKIVPRKGCAVMWSNVLSKGVEDPRTEHLGLPPRTGTKYGLNCFFNEKPLKQWQELNREWEESDETAPRATPRCSTVDPAELGDPDGTSHVLRAFTVCSNPKVNVVPGFLSRAESQLLCSMVEQDAPRPNGWQDALAEIEQRMALLASLPLDQMERMRVSKCETHMIPDGQVLARGNYYERFGRKAVHLFLNDVAEGGHLCFPRLGLQVRPREGAAVVWSGFADDSSTQDAKGAHQGRPPKCGTRFSAVGVFRDEKAREV